MLIIILQKQQQQHQRRRIVCKIVNTGEKCFNFSHHQTLWNSAAEEITINIIKSDPKQPLSWIHQSFPLYFAIVKKMSPPQDDLLSIFKRTKTKTPSNVITMILTAGATFSVTLYLLQQPLFVDCSPETTITNRSNNLAEQTKANSSINSSNSSSSSSNSDSNNNITNEKQIPLVRLPSNTLLKYTAYKDVSILHFRIPVDTQTALFSFKAYEESKSAFSKYLPTFI